MSHPHRTYTTVEKVWFLIYILVMAIMLVQTFIFFVKQRGSCSLSNFQMQLKLEGSKERANR